MGDLSKIIIESNKINDLLRSCYQHVDDKVMPSPFDSAIKDLKEHIDAIDLCYKENVLDMDEDLDSYLKGYIDYLTDYYYRAERYRSAYITWRISKDLTMPDKCEEDYSKMFDELQLTDADGKYAEDALIRIIKEKGGAAMKTMTKGVDLSGISKLNVKYSIFISSTYEDLKEERLSLMSVLLSKNFIPVGMELFHAVPTSQWNVITKMIDGCDYYLLVVGGRYGSIDESVGVSYTEKEYDYAKANGIPVIAFLPMYPEKMPFDKLDKTDLTENQKRLKSFKDKIQNQNNTVTYYNNIDSLRYEVSVSLDRLVEYAPRDGWIRRSEIVKYFENNE